MLEVRVTMMIFAYQIDSEVGVWLYADRERVVT